MDEDSAPDGTVVVDNAAEENAVVGTVMVVKRAAVDDNPVDGTAVDGTAVDGTAVDGAAVDGTAVDGAEVDGDAVDGDAVEGAIVAIEGIGPTNDSGRGRQVPVPPSAQEQVADIVVEFMWHVLFDAVSGE